MKIKYNNLNLAFLNMSLKKEYFKNIQKIKYDPNADRTNSLVFRHYNEDEIVLGKSMKDWLRFSVCCWHTFVW